MRLALFFFAASAFAQNCYFTPGNTVNCPTNGSQSPDIKTFATDTVASFQTMYGKIAGLPQPKIPTGMEITPASTTWITADPPGCQGPPNTCVFANATALNNYIDTTMLDTAHGNTPIGACADWNIDPLPYTQAAEYTGSASPPDAAFEAYLLGVQDTVAQHLKAKGFCLRIATAPFTSAYTACGLTPSTMTEVQMANCLNPMYAALVAHMHNLSSPVTIADFTGFHEPTGMWHVQTGQIFTYAQVAAFVNSYSSVVTGAPGGSGIKIGVGVMLSENTYVTYLAANVSTSVLQFIGVDAYGISNPSAYAATMASYANYCTEALAAGFACKARLRCIVQVPVSATKTTPTKAVAGWAGKPTASTISGIS
jgi:hypothetical protein